MWAVMCSLVRCPQCGLITWVGCGDHVEEIFRGVPDDQVCRCD